MDYFVLVAVLDRIFPPLRSVKTTRTDETYNLQP